jgi:hypothetical protein
MPTTEDTTAVDASVELDDYNGKTMTVHRMKRGGKMRFKNKNLRNELLINSNSSPPPFIVEGSATPRSWFTVARDTPAIVTISDAYDVGMSFTYSAQINGTTAEDPIVIIDRR